MKAYKVFRWFLRASALTTVMFIMQACYGSPNMPSEMPDDTELTAENDSLVEENLQSAGVEYQELQSE